MSHSHNHHQHNTLLVPFPNKGGKQTNKSVSYPIFNVHFLRLREKRSVFGGKIYEKAFFSSNLFTFEAFKNVWTTALKLYSLKGNEPTLTVWTATLHELNHGCQTLAGLVWPVVSYLALEANTKSELAHQYCVARVLLVLQISQCTAGKQVKSRVFIVTR